MAEHADLVEIPPAPSQLVEDEPGIAEARFGRLAQLALGDLNGILDPFARKLHGGLKALALNCHWK
uniref:FXSXX-COOH protein n=1 Tax=Streptomyces sp. NBC_01393 TaxID=2903851 RepID=A0AAU3HR27_9ACTN